MNFIGEITYIFVYEIGDGISMGIAWECSNKIFIGIIVGIALGLIIRITFKNREGIYEIFIGLMFGIFLGILVNMVVGTKEGYAVGISFIIGNLRLYYLPIYLSFLFPYQNFLIKFHPVYWDDLCSVPFPWLERLLIAHVEANRVEGKAAIERIIDSYPAQRWGAQKAKTILTARSTAKIQNICDVENLINQLPEGQKGFLTQTRRIKDGVHEICQLQHQIETMNRPFLKAPMARERYVQIENFIHEIGGFAEPLVSAFRKAANAWLAIARKQKEQVAAILAKEVSPQVFRAGDPVSREQEAFIPRYRVVGELEKQIMLSTGCPGLVLYGRRRMGKTTILKNLGGFLPPSVKSVFISMQSARAFTSIKDLNQLLAENFTRILLEMKITIGSDDSLKSIFDILEAVNNHLKPEKWKKDDPKRPGLRRSFGAKMAFNGFDNQAGSWPHLVQLIAETIVDLVNDSDKTQADDTIFEQALNQSIVKGHNVLYELMHGECKLSGEWEYLAAFRRKASQPIPDNEALYRSLKRRLLVVEENSEFRLRVPLMERWLKERG